MEGGNWHSEWANNGMKKKKMMKTKGRDNDVEEAEAEPTDAALITI